MGIILGFTGPIVINSSQRQKFIAMKKRCQLCHFAKIELLLFKSMLFKEASDNQVHY